MRERGFTLLEMTIAGFVAAMLLAAATASLTTEGATHRVLTAQFGPEAKGRQALERVASDLRMAGRWGEDRNRDGILSAGEDQNNNGILDADWRIGDEREHGKPVTEPRSSIRFNRRVDDVAADGTILASGIYTGAVSYGLEDGRLVRRTTVGGTVQRVILAEGVSDFRVLFDADRDIVTLSLDVRLPPGVFATDTRTFTTSVWLRN